MTVIFFSEGGLGNQLFQFAYLKKTYSKHKIIVFGFDELGVFINLDELTIFKNQHKFYKFLNYIVLRRIFKALSFLRIISKNEVLRKNDIEIVSDKVISGIFKSIIFQETGFFQSEKFIEKNFSDHIIKRKKKEWIKKDLTKKNMVFVHFRQGDYVNYKVFGKSTIMPESYFKKSILKIENSIKNPVYYIFSDSDITKQQLYIFKNKKYVVEKEKNQFIVLNKMSSFSNAIISPSSFSWWATYLIKKKGIIIVPNYWLGFFSKKNYPSDPFCDYMTKIDP